MLCHVVQVCQQLYNLTSLQNFHGFSYFVNSNLLQKSRILCSQQIIEYWTKNVDLCSQKKKNNKTKNQRTNNTIHNTIHQRNFPLFYDNTFCSTLSINKRKKTTKNHIKQKHNIWQVNKKRHWKKHHRKQHKNNKQLVQKKDVQKKINQVNRKKYKQKTSSLYKKVKVVCNKKKRPLQKRFKNSPKK